MFMQPNSNQTITVTKSDDGKYIIQHYETIINSANSGIITQIQPQYIMKTYVALDEDDAGAIVATKLKAMK